MIIHILLFLIAYVLFLPLAIATYFILLFKGNHKGYFLSSARNLDIYANREFRTLWNNTLRKPYSYEFGDEGETISSVLGKLQRDNTLTRAGKVLAFILDTLDKEHCKNSIMTNIKAGRLIPIENQDIKLNESVTYIRVYVEDADGKNERPLFLTPHELKVIEERTEKNKEDWRKKGWLQDLID